MSIDAGSARPPVRTGAPLVASPSPGADAPVPMPVSGPFHRRLAALVAISHGTVRGWVRHLLAQLEYLGGRLDPFVRLDPQRTRRLVFVCWGNINRSAFAAEVARRHGAHAVSIGLSTTTGKPAYPMAVSAARELGHDLRAHTATALGDYRYEEGDVLVVMEVRHARRVRARDLLQAPVLLLGHWTFPRRIHLHDPYTLSPDYFRSCFSLIESGCARLVHQLRVAGSPCIRP